ncbi:MAG: GIY-YIG nuclease family protein [Treponema sp.]
MKKILKFILLFYLYILGIGFLVGTVTANETNSRVVFAFLCGITVILISKIRTSKKQATQNFVPPQNNDLLFQKYSQRISSLETENNILKNKFAEIGGNDYDAVQNVIVSKQQEVESLNITISENNAIVDQQLEKIQAIKEESAKLEKKSATLQVKVARLRFLFDGIIQAVNDYHDDKEIFALTNLINEADELSPSVILKLHNMDYKDLKKAYNDNDKAISQVLEVYEGRYTTKANKSIYQLMVIALRAELQNILYNLKYDKLDKSIDDIKHTSAKYLKIAGEGNQSISGTLTRFISEIEYLFINAAKIEYNYYVKREQAKQEQAAIREQIRQEAAERKALEAERKKIEQEEAKYTTEIDKLQATLLETANNDEVEQLKARILELQSHLSAVVVKKDEIVNLQNGKAGNVYIISNLGSFGDNVFKIGMTRRLNPQERIDELGSASVPFKFDVHSFIFSQDAVALESNIHERLNNQRVNKVNLRKEFFKVSIDELEKLVNELDPTAEFNKTILAEEYRQSLSTDENYTSDNTVYENDEYLEYIDDVE